MLQRGGSGGTEEKLSSIFKPCTCMFPVRTLEACEAAGRRPLLQPSVPNCWGEAVGGSGWKKRSSSSKEGISGRSQQEEA